MNIEISFKNQSLGVYSEGRLKVEYVVSCAVKGCGQQQHSEKTPLGLHCIAEKIGADKPKNAVFVARQWTGEIYTPELAQREPGRDWILSRILWLQGLEPGVNQGGNVDSHARFIYIHGTNEEDKIGQPASHGCIRMRNDDVIDLFDQVELGTKVLITL